MNANTYTLTVNNMISGTYARKDTAVKHGDASGQSFEVFSPSGKKVHSVTVETEQPSLDTLIAELVAAAVAVKFAKAGYARLVGADGKSIAWVNEHHVDFPGTAPRVNLDGALGMLRSVA
jgi:hypothetical protein